MICNLGGKIQPDNNINLLDMDVIYLLIEIIKTKTVSPVGVP